MLSPRIQVVQVFANHMEYLGVSVYCRGPGSKTLEGALAPKTSTPRGVSTLSLNGQNIRRTVK